MHDSRIIRSLADPMLDQLCAALAALAPELDRGGHWPGEQLRLAGEHGVFAWFQDEAWGGLGWSEADLLRGYLRLGAGCLTTSFIVTQRAAASSRIAAGDSHAARERWLPDLAAGKIFATVAISHLTTSRRHLAKPVLAATETPRGFVLNGFSPWVTGGSHAQVIVVGATLDDGGQILVAVPTDLPGVSPAPGQALVGLAASHTGEVRLDSVEVKREWLLAGPAENVMKLGKSSGAGGLQTSALAIGHAAAAIGYLRAESAARPELLAPAAELQNEQGTLADDMLRLAIGAGDCSAEQVRARANSLALRASQSALAAAKGAGYVVGHPAGRWCREALFFLVWSCPQPVMAANLCELAGLD